MHTSSGLNGVKKLQQTFILLKSLPDFYLKKTDIFAGLFEKSVVGV